MRNIGSTINRSQAFGESDGFWLVSSDLNGFGLKWGGGGGGLPILQLSGTASVSGFAGRLREQVKFRAESRLMTSARPPGWTSCCGEEEEGAEFGLNHARPGSGVRRVGWGGSDRPAEKTGEWFRAPHLQVGSGSIIQKLQTHLRDQRRPLGLDRSCFFSGIGPEPGCSQRNKVMCF